MGERGEWVRESELRRHGGEGEGERVEEMWEREGSG